MPTSLNGISRTSVALVDDHTAVRQMVGSTLERDGPFTVIGEAASGLDAIRMLQSKEPELLLLDLSLPEGDGRRVLDSIRDGRMATRVVIFTGSRNEDLILSALQAGPHGFVHKSDPLATLVEAVGAVVRGCSFFTPFATRILDRHRQSKPRGVVALSPNERVVLQLLAEGGGSKQIASTMGLSVKTVEHYRMRLAKKLGIRDLAGLTRLAVRWGLVDA